MKLPYVERSKLLALLVAFACVAVSGAGLQLSESELDYQEVKGVVGTPVSINGGRLVVNNVRVATSISRQGEVETRTAGLFVVASVTLAAPGQKVSLSSARLLSGTRVYDAYSSWFISADPGFQGRSDAVFEVDPTRIDNLTLELWQTGIVNGYYQRATVFLGITEDNAWQWRDAAKGRSVEIQRFPTSEVIG